MRKAMTLLLVLLVLLGGMSVAYAEESNLVKVVIKDGVCTITKIGEEPELGFTIDVLQPNEDIHTLIVGEGIRNIWIKGESSSGVIKVKDVYLPASLENIDYSYCENYYVDDKNPHLCSVDGVLFSKDRKTLKNYGKLKSIEEYNVPAGTEKIAVGVSFGKTIRKLIFPESIKKIEAFFNESSNLDEIVFPNNIEDIDIFSLKNTPWYINGNMRIVGNGILIGPCNEDVLKTPEGCRTIAGHAFNNQNFEKIIIGNSVKKIGNSAFEGCSIGELIINNGIEEIAGGAFSYIHNDDLWIEEIYLPDSLKTLGESFSFAKVNNIYLPSNYNGYCPSSFLSNLYVNSQSETAKMASECGMLVFDVDTRKPILPSGERAYYSLNHIKENEWVDLGYYINETGESIAFETKKPFIFMYDLYVPLRYMCEKYGINIYWNNDLGIAEVGEKTEIESEKDNTAVFGNENLVVYNGKRLKAKYSVLIEDYVAGSAHSSINIDGTIYVPLSDFVHGTGIGTLYNYNMSPINSLIIESN